MFIGTNNGNPREPDATGDKGVLMCFAERDGSFLWQAVHDKLPNPQDNDWPDVGITSTPAVVGDRVYYVSNDGKLVCADVEGFHDNDNDGPFDSEPRTGRTAADIVWQLDMVNELGVVPLHASASPPLVVDGLVFVVTGNGANPTEGVVPAPKAPSFIAVDAKNGKVVWQDMSPGDRILAGQWSSPAYGVVDGKPMVVFPGGDAWLYAFEPRTGKLIWKFNGRANETAEDGVYESINQLVATPVIHKNRVYIAVGQDPESGDGDGCLWSIDATKTGDISQTGQVWKRERRDFGRSISTVAIADGLLYAVELGGYLQCINVDTGEQYWRHDLMASVWGSPVVADGKVYVINEDGTVHIFAHNKEKKLLAENEMNDASHGTVAIANSTLFIVAGKKLFALNAKP